jgi:hypothetical protein
LSTATPVTDVNPVQVLTTFEPDGVSFTTCASPGVSDDRPPT